MVLNGHHALEVVTRAGRDLLYLPQPQLAQRTLEWIP